MTFPKIIILDRDSTLNFSSSDPQSPLYYITSVENLIIKPNVTEAIKLIRSYGIKTVLATRQKCISKGLVSRQRVDIINFRLERLIDAHFEQVFVEESSDNKEALFKDILSSNPSVQPHQMVLIDDSPKECGVAAKLGIPSYQTDVLSAVKSILKIS